MTVQHVVVISGDGCVEIELEAERVLCEHCSCAYGWKGWGTGHERGDTFRLGSALMRRGSTEGRVGVDEDVSDMW